MVETRRLKNVVFLSQQKKCYNLLQEIRSTQDPEKVVFNFSKYVLLGFEKSPPTEGLNFNISSEK